MHRLCWGLAQPRRAVQKCSSKQRHGNNFCLTFGIKPLSWVKLNLFFNQLKTSLTKFIVFLCPLLYLQQEGNLPSSPSHLTRWGVSLDLSFQRTLLGTVFSLQVVCHPATDSSSSVMWAVLRCAYESTLKRIQKSVQKMPNWSNFFF